MTSTHEAAAATSGAVQPRGIDVSWRIDPALADRPWLPPRRLKRDDPAPQHAKSASYCPAVIDYETRMIEIACPADLRLALERHDGGFRLAGDGALPPGVALLDQAQWISPARPVLAVQTPMIVEASQPCWATQLPPMTYYRPEPLPGVTIGRRFALHPAAGRPLWLFEWWDVARPLHLAQGEPWFYLRFETVGITRPIRFSLNPVTAKS